jgi:hypothetical protein
MGLVAISSCPLCGQVPSILLLPAGGPIDPPVLPNLLNKIEGSFEGLGTATMFTQVKAVA